MGSEQFIQVVSGKSAQQAFYEAIRQAEHDYGHSGYTGTIAEKNSFIEITLPKKKKTENRAIAYAEKLLAENDPRIDDKWGPAGCISLGKNKYLFFGWASS